MATNQARVHYYQRQVPYRTWRHNRPLRHHQQLHVCTKIDNMTELHLFVSHDILSYTQQIDRIPQYLRIVCNYHIHYQRKLRVVLRERQVEHCLLVLVQVCWVEAKEYQRVILIVEGSISIIPFV